MAIQKITYSDKSYINENASIAAINKVQATDMNEIKSVVNTNADKVGDLTSLTTTDKDSVVEAINELDTGVKKIGKLLWSGSFTTGSITVSGLSDYEVIICVVGGCTCIGSKAYGVGGVGAYGAYTTNVFNYRFGVSGNTLTIDSVNKGGSNGTENQPITAIYGLI